MAPGRLPFWGKWDWGRFLNTLLHHLRMYTFIFFYASLRMGASSLSTSVLFTKISSFYHGTLGGITFSRKSFPLPSCPFTKSSLHHFFVFPTLLMLVNGNKAIRILTSRYVEESSVIGVLFIVNSSDGSSLALSGVIFFDYFSHCIFFAFHLHVSQSMLDSRI